MEPPSPLSPEISTATGDEDRDSGEDEANTTLIKTSSRLDDNQINQLNLQSLPKDQFITKMKGDYGEKNA